LLKPVGGDAAQIGLGRVAIVERHVVNHDQVLIGRRAADEDLSERARRSALHYLHAGTSRRASTAVRIRCACIDAALTTEVVVPTSTSGWGMRVAVTTITIFGNLAAGLASAWGVL
jgi:hypothetical protein